MPVSKVCEKHRIQPTLFYLWQKTFFENGTAAFERRSSHSRVSLDAFNADADPVRVFEQTWQVLKGFGLRYNQKDSWERLNVCGIALLEKFIRDEISKITAIQAVEKRFELLVTSLDLPLVGIIDLVANLEGTPTVADFKSMTVRKSCFRISSAPTSWRSPKLSSSRSVCS